MLPSYNEDLFVLSNQTALEDAFGDHYSWSKTARAQLFARYHATVVDEASLVALMRRNDFTTDDVGTQGCPPGFRSASNAIAERGDLTYGPLCLSGRPSCCSLFPARIPPPPPPRPS